MTVLVTGALNSHTWVRAVDPSTCTTRWDITSDVENPRQGRDGVKSSCTKRSHSARRSGHRDAVVSVAVTAQRFRRYSTTGGIGGAHCVNRSLTATLLNSAASGRVVLAG